jgi:hypothetical protein
MKSWSQKPCWTKPGELEALHPLVPLRCNLRADEPFEQVEGLPYWPQFSQLYSTKHVLGAPCCLKANCSLMGFLPLRNTGCMHGPIDLYNSKQKMSWMPTMLMSHVPMRKNVLDTRIVVAVSGKNAACSSCLLIHFCIPFYWLCKCRFFQTRGKREIDHIVTSTWMPI